MDSENTAGGVAMTVLMRGLQSWGQSVDERVAAWQSAIDYIGLSVKLGYVEEDGQKVLTGDGDEADLKTAGDFMSEVRRNFPLGKFETEVEMIKRCLDRYKQNKKQ